MASLRKMAECIGVVDGGTFSIVGDFFGYASPPPWNTAPSQDNLPQSLSVLTQMKRLKRKHFHLDIIRVGTDANGNLAAVDEENIDCAVQWTRDIYAQINVGIGRVIRWWLIPAADEPDLLVIDDNSEASDLISDFDADGGGIDAFFVKAWAGNTTGYTPNKGDGVAVELQENNFLETARTLAHELGHYFGLGHRQDEHDNIMCQSGPANDMPTSILFDPDQAETVRDDGEMNDPC